MRRWWSKLILADPHRAQSNRRLGVFKVNWRLLRVWKVVCLRGQKNGVTLLVVVASGWLVGETGWWSPVFIPAGRAGFNSMEISRPFHTLPVSSENGFAAGQLLDPGPLPSWGFDKLGPVVSSRVGRPFGMNHLKQPVSFLACQNSYWENAPQISMWCRNIPPVLDVRL